MPELGVGRRPHGVVDLGDDLRGRSKRLGRELRGHHVAVVALGQGEEDVGALGARAAQHVLVGAVAADRRCPPNVDGRRSKAAVDMSRTMTS